MVANASLINIPSQAGKLVDPSLLGNSLARALLSHGTPAGSSTRFDAVGRVGALDTLDAYHLQVDSDFMREWGNKPLPEWMRSDSFRGDALPIGAGGFPRQFEYIRSRIFEQHMMPLNGSRLFATDRTVPLGARQHTARRALAHGEAVIYRGGNNYGRASSSYAEEQFGVVYITCAVDTNFLDLLTTDWVGLRQYERDMRYARRAVDERLNRIIWHGDPASKVYGILTYPHVAKEVIPVEFSDASAPEDIARALADLANTPIIESGGTFRANAMAMSVRQRAYISSTKHSSSGGTDLTIMQFFLNNQPDDGIKSIQDAQELSGIGPAGEDGILCYRTDQDTAAHVMLQDPTALPVFQATPMDQTTVVFAATGGMVCPDSGNIILGYAANED